MKKSIVALAISTLIGGSMLTSCQSSALKVENAQENVQDAADDLVDAKEELNEALNDSIQLFKKIAAKKIQLHEKSLADFKARIKKDKLANRTQYEQRLVELEQKNTDLKKTLDEYKAESRENWMTFKLKITNDINAVGETIKELTK